MPSFNSNAGPRCKCGVRGRRLVIGRHTCQSGGFLFDDADAGGCDGSRKVNLSAEEAAIHRTDADRLAAAGSYDLNRALPFWSDDATMLVPGVPRIEGREAVRKYVTESFAAPGFAITWKTEKVEVSQSGDLAYSTGTDRISVNGPDGKPLTEEGRGVTIWKKQTDGSWRCVLDVMSPAEASSVK